MAARGVKVILNPIASRGKARAVWPSLLRYFYLKYTYFDYEFLQYPRHTIPIVRQALYENYSSIIIVGGLATLSEAIQGFINSNEQLINPKAKLGFFFTSPHIDSELILQKLLHYLDEGTDTQSFTFPLFKVALLDEQGKQLRRSGRLLSHSLRMGEHKKKWLKDHRLKLHWTKKGLANFIVRRKLTPMVKIKANDINLGVVQMKSLAIFHPLMLGKSPLQQQARNNDISLFVQTISPKRRQAKYQEIQREKLQNINLTNDKNDPREQKKAISISSKEPRNLYYLLDEKILRGQTIQITSLDKSIHLFTFRHQ